MARERASLAVSYSVHELVRRVPRDKLGPMKQQPYKFVSVEEFMSVHHVGRKEDFIIACSLENASVLSMSKVKMGGGSEKKALQE